VALRIHCRYLIQLADWMKASETHLRASLPYLAGQYMGEHWLATFALLALRPAV